MAPTSDLVHMALHKRDVDATYIAIRVIIGVAVLAVVVTGGVLIYFRNKRWRYRQTNGAPDGINRVYG